MRSCSFLLLWLAAASIVCPSAVAKEKAPPLEGQHRILVLPLEFGCFKSGLGSYEPMPEKTKESVDNLNGSLWRALRREKALEFTPMPELSAQESATLVEHIALLRQATTSALLDLQVNHIPWGDRRRGRMEYSIGNGLAFLAERSGTEFAVLVSGGREIPSAGRMIVTVGAFALGALPITSDKMIAATVIELRTGDMVSVFVEDRILEGEPYDVAGANTWIHKLFETFPDKPLNKPWTRALPKKKPAETYNSSYGFSVKPPRGWRGFKGLGAANLSLHSVGLEHIRVDREFLGGPASSDLLAIGRSEAKRLRTSGALPNLEVVGVEPATFSNRPGFRVEMTSTRDFLGTPIRFRHLLYGVTDGSHVYLLQYDAPAIHYYDAYLPAVAATLATYEVH